jgi:phage repressor protein C with HTH and peptisase S24 domain
MAKTEKSLAIGAALRTARKQRGKVMRQVAEALDIDVAAVGNWETGKNLPSTENLIRAAEFLCIDATDLARGVVRYLDAADLADAEIVSDFAPFPAGSNDVELRGATVGGDDADFTFNGQIVGYVRRPAGIARMNNVFALDVIGDSMVPRFEPAEMVYCHARAPQPGDDIVVEMFPDDGDVAGKCFIKRLVRQSAKELVCKQFNPPKEIVFDRYAIKHVWRVIPLRELVGF